MNRLIKFRVWRDAFAILNGEIYPGTWLPDRCLGPDGRVYLDDCGLCSEHYVEEYGGNLHVEQFTGLTDSTNRDIYEGDIVQFRVGHGTDFDAHREITVEVVWIPETASFAFDDHTEVRYMVTVPQVGSLKVVGNIHEDSTWFGIAVA